MEPFGVTPLEAMCKDTPTIVTKQSGVSEVINHAFKVDWWDIDKMASQVINLLKFPVLHKVMKFNGKKEALSLDWDKPARECIKLYNELSS
jgi:glycosyltransferase involved in cell wall biosynthesis